MSLPEIAAIAFAVITAGIVAFQIALALGAPWGEYAMGGGTPGAFPPSLRAGAVVQAALLALLAGVVLARAGVALADTILATGWLIWVAVGVSTLSLVLNVITRSIKERRMWAPVAFLMLASSLAVALTA